MRRFIVDRSKFSLIELWRLTRFGLPRWALGRLTGTIPRFGSESLAPDSLAEIEVGDVSNLPIEARAIMETFIADAKAEGYVEPLVHLLEERDVDVGVVVLRASDGRSACSQHVAVSRAFDPPLVESTAGVTALLDDGTWIVSTSRASRLHLPPGIRELPRPDATIGELRRALHHELERSSRRARPIPDSDTLRSLLDEYENTQFSWLCGRGLYVPRPTPGDSASVDMPSESAPSSGTSGRDELETFESSVLALIDLPQVDTTRWTSSVVVATLSLALFVAVGGLQWSWELAAMISGVLLAHELGHLAAMRAFGYKNPRMFFLPLLGAAVTGQAHGAPGWKRTLVTLAGPLPGIAVAAGLLAANAAIGDPGLARLAHVSFVLNGLNLLPFRPLDGGWVIDALLASRAPGLTVAFRVISSLGLLAAGIHFHSWILAGLAALMLFGMRREWKLARVSSRLLREGAVFHAVGGGIPRDEALAILRRLREEIRGTSSSHVAAAHVSEIHDRLSSRSPGLATTIVLLALHACGGVVAVAGTRLALERELELSAGVMDGPSWPEPLWAMTSFETEARGDDSAATHLVFVQVADETRASSRLPSLSAALVPGERLTRFGSTIIAATNAARAPAWTERLREEKEQPRIDLVEDENDTFVELSCRVDSEAHAKSLVADANLSFGGEWPGLRPAWVSPDPGLHPEQSKTDLRRRRALASCQDAVLEAMLTDLPVEEIQARDASSSEEEDAALFRECLDLLVGADEGMRPEERDAARAAIAARVGAIPVGHPDGVHVPITGIAYHVDRMVTCNPGFLRADLSLPLVSEWLKRSGCGDLRYGWVTIDFTDGSLR